VTGFTRKTDVFFAYSVNDLDWVHRLPIGHVDSSWVQMSDQVE